MLEREASPASHPCAVESCSAALQASEPLNTCSIAARLSPKESGLGKPVSAFNGQMGCIYLFADVLSPGDSTTHVCLSVCMSPGNRAHECYVVWLGGCCFTTSFDRGHMEVCSGSVLLQLTMQLSHNVYWLGR